MHGNRHMSRSVVMLDKYDLQVRHPYGGLSTCWHNLQ